MRNLQFLDARQIEPSPAEATTLPVVETSIDAFTGAQPIQAAAVPWTTRVHGNNHTATSGLTRDLEELQQFLREGNPGVLGSAVDIIGNASTMLTPVPQKLTANGWSTQDAPEMFEFINFFRGPNSSPQQMIARLFRLLEVPGAVAIALVRNHEDRWVYVMCPRNKAKQINKDTVALQTVDNAKPGSPGYWEAPTERTWIGFAEDPFCPDQPYSPMIRGLESLRMYRQARRQMGRNLDSMLAMNGVMWAKAMPGVDVNGKPKWMTSMAEWAKVASGQRHQMDRTVADFVPFMMQTSEKPEHLQVGRDDFGQLTELADWNCRQFAKDIDFPTSWLENGPGTEKYSNAFFQSNWFADMTMSARSARVASLLTQVVLRTWLLAANGNGILTQFNPDEWRFWFDDSALRPAGEQNLAIKADLAKQGKYNCDHLVLELAGGDEAALPKPEDESVDNPGPVPQLESGAAPQIEAAPVAAEWSNDLVAW